MVRATFGMLRRELWLLCLTLWTDYNRNVSNAMLEKKIRVCYYVAGSMANYNAFYFDDEKKAREKRAELLAYLPSKYEVQLEYITENE